MSEQTPLPHPFTRPVDVERIARREDGIRVEADQQELLALAQFLKIPSVQSAVGEFRITGDSRRARVTGTVGGRITQTCVVTLENFDSDVSEEVELRFEAARDNLSPEELERRAIDPPDEIVDGKIDLGAVTTEFLALGLDPYPRKPGVEFEPPQEGRERETPFAALSKLRREE
jgi:uncharacterized metal-binding protein YceD (DUF177 family)